MKRLSTDTIYNLSTQELLVVRQEVDNRKKHNSTAWLLWLFLGWFGAHRIYLKQTMTGFLMLSAFFVSLVLSIYLATIDIVGFLGLNIHPSVSVSNEQATLLTTLAYFVVFMRFAIPVWWIIDAFLISTMLRDNEKRVQEEVIQDLVALRGQVQYQQPMQGQSNPPPQMFRCPNCGNSIIYGANPCPHCRVMIRW